MWSGLPCMNGTSYGRRRRSATTWPTRPAASWTAETATSALRCPMSPDRRVPCAPVGCPRAPGPASDGLVHLDGVGAGPGPERSQEPVPRGQPRPGLDRVAVVAAGELVLGAGGEVGVV